MKNTMLVIAALTLAATSASAATYYTQPTDNNLRLLVTAANANPGDDVIVMRSGTYVLSTCPVASTDEDFFDLNLNGDLDVIDLSGGGLTFQAAGWPLTGLVELTTSCENQRLIDNHGPGVVTLRGMTLTNGTASFGGGIRSQVAPLIVEGTVMRQNSATNGGAIWASGALFVALNSRFEYNSATSSGGAVNLIGSAAEISGSQFVNNSTTENGGAIYAGHLTVLEMNDALIEANSAKEGGGLYAVNVQGTVAASKFKYNYAVSDVQGFNGNGGAAFFYCTLPTQPSNPPYPGHDMTPPFLPGCTTSFYDTDFLVNVVDGTSSANGGAIWAYFNQINVYGGSFVGNYAQGSGANLRLWASHGIFDDVLFYDNHAEVHSGVLDARYYSYVVSRNSRYLENTAGGHAGANFIAQDSIATFESDLFQGNSANYGGGLTVQTQSRVEVLDSEFLDNSATSTCGAIEDLGSQFTRVTLSLIQGNSSRTGGGACGSALQLQDSMVLRNHASAIGGGLHTSGSGFTAVYQSTIAENVSGNVGGGVSGGVYLNASTVADNYAASGFGTAIYQRPTESLYLYESTIARNGSGSLNGWQLYLPGYYAMTGSYIGNAPDNVADCNVTSGSPTTQLILNTYDTDGSCALPAGGGNISAGPPAEYGPLLGYYGGPTMTLQMIWSSPIIDRFACSKYQDQRHVSRFHLATCDYGATEYIGEDDAP